MTSEALEGSIKKWEGIVAGTKADLGPEDCPLCQVYRRGGNGCHGCPVMAKTGLPACRASPWEDWCDAFHGGLFSAPRVADTPEKMAAAEAEVAFLKSLR